MIGLATTAAILVLIGGAVTYFACKAADKMMAEEAERERKSKEWSD